MTWPAYIAYPFLRLFIRRIDGMKNIPQGPCIIASNHSSYIDGPILCAAIKWHTGILPRFIIAKNQAGGPLRRWFLSKVMHQIIQGDTVRKSVTALAKGDAIAIFPEGGRTDTGKIFHTEFTGLGAIACLSGAPVIPVAIQGTYDLWPRTKKYPLLARCVNIKIGKQIMFKKQKGRIPQATAKEAVTKVMRKIGSMLGQEYPVEKRKTLPWEKK
jgi:1-acyl-sn-glycerol-3-phosphate acyltransferase